MILDLRCKLSAFLAALLVFATIAPGVACADTWISEVVYTTDTYTERNSIVVSDSPYNAASLVMGKNAILLTDEQKSYLSDPAFCPNFVDYASTFVGIDASSIPDWVPAYMVPIVLDRMLGASTWGGGYVYASTATNFQYELAESEFNDILNGDYPSGGGSSGEEESDTATTFILSRNAYFSSAGNNYLTFNGVNYNLYPLNTYNWPDGNTITIEHSSVDKSIYSQCAILMYPYKGTKFYVSLIFAKPGQIRKSVNEYGDFRFIVSGAHYYRNTQMPVSKVQSIPLSGTFDVGDLDYSSGNKTYDSFGCLYSDNDTGSPAPPDPDGDWPEDPETPSPTPPELPEIDDNPVPTEPDETDININLPDVIITGGQSATDLTDVISILKVINGNLVTINRNIESEFNSVINAFNAIGGQIEQFALRVREHCQHIRSAIYHNTTHLENQIYKLFHWLERELDYGFTGYDDTSLLSYLRRILAKLSNPSNPNYMPNPIADEDNFFDWLLDLWHRFLIDLASILPESMLGLLDLFSQLTHYFPFSIPWDIGAMLALLVHDPVAPVFDIPYPFGPDHSAAIHIDLSPWQPMVSLIRPILLVMFCYNLALGTKRLISHVNVTEGGV